MPIDSVTMDAGEPVVVAAERLPKKSRGPHNQRFEGPTYEGRTGVPAARNDVSTRAGSGGRRSPTRPLFAGAAARSACPQAFLNESTFTMQMQKWLVSTVLGLTLVGGAGCGPQE
ncbi:hypothetical protein, partial [Corallococcus sp. AB049A]|uniref:hypothetical protein n=1 Tax=Corallococcus sp. AB049A TaxID=2316721 RepID=UPI001F457DC4